MTVVKLFAAPHVVWQTPDDEDMPIAEPAIAVYLDVNGLLVLNQEGREIIANRSTLPDLLKLLQRLAKEAL